MCSRRLRRVAFAPRTFASLKDVPEDFRIAIGTPESVPAGHYAQEAFTNLGIWSDVKPRCIQAEDVAAVLTYVRRGEVDVGVAYGSELVGIDGVASLEVASGDWAPHPLVVAVAVKDGPHPKAAAAFLTFLQSKEARAIFDRFGFGAP